MGISAVMSAAGAVPVGVVNPFAGATAPAGWLLCAGQLVSRTQYPVLFNTIGTVYGAGDGTTFGIPDMRGRTVAGVDNMGGTAANILTATVLNSANTLGATGGTQTHILTEAQMPSHTHTQNAHTHIQDPHNHTLRGDEPSYSGNPLVPKLQPWYNYVGIATSSVINNTTAVNLNTTATNNNTGSGSAHLNTQPTIVLNYIIKAQ